jgi:uncharacterized protein (DUF2141 family)
VIAGLAVSAEAATLQVVVAGVRNGTGNVMVAVCTEQNFLTEKCEYNGLRCLERSRRSWSACEPG